MMQIPSAPSEVVFTRRETCLAMMREFNLLSDRFLSVVLRDPAACQHILRIILRMPELIITTARTQYAISMVVSHDARLDVLAEDTSGMLCAIEIQRSETIDHPRRERFYGAMIDSEILEKGATYSQMPDLKLIYISETDIWHAGRTKYTIRKHLDETGIPYHDGIEIVFVNAEVDDGSELTQLMKYFKTADPDDMSQGDLSKRVHFLKCEKGGALEMCAITDAIYAMAKEDYLQKGIELGIEQGIEQGIEKNKQLTAARLKEQGMNIDFIAGIVDTDSATVQQWLSGGAGLF